CTSPALDAVRAAPRALLEDLDFVYRRLLFEMAPVDGQVECAFAALDALEQPRKAHLAEPLVVPVGFSVGREMHEAGQMAVLALERGKKRCAVAQRAPERDRMCERAVVEEHRDLAAGAEADEIRHARVDGLVAVEHGPVLASDAPDAARLARRQDREAHAFVGELLEGRRIGGALRQPQAFAAPPEAKLEIAQSPDDLGAAVAGARERQDRMRVALRDRRAVTGKTTNGIAIAGHERFVDVALLARKIREKRRAEIEAHVRVVHELALAEVALGVRQQARCAVRAIALFGDALVPVVRRRGTGLRFDAAGPRIFARRLVEVAVDAERRLSHHGSSQRSHTPARGGSTRSIEHGLPCIGASSVATAPRLPQPVPP